MYLQPRRNDDISTVNYLNTNKQLPETMLIVLAKLSNDLPRKVSYYYDVTFIIIIITENVKYY